MEFGEELERKHVQVVYNAIAPHFSATRYKPWPVVENFLKSQEVGSLGADVGCGNGKYLGVNPNTFCIGSDMSFKLIDICKQRGFESMVCDNLSLSYRSGSFDFAISIAVIHHFSSFERRRDAIKELLRILKPGGSVLIFVWAMEQEGKRKFEQQDVFVPWSFPKEIFKSKGEAADTPVLREDDKTVVYQRFSEVSALPNFFRFYHVFKKGELEETVMAAGGVEIVDAGYDRDNWYVIAKKYHGEKPLALGIQGI
ncbi:Alkylated DNA repair protein alkB 8 [Dinochytrium kinnereticum]|nr:Alkylated DNA repair protein alkB 8 [Dinochytrium kinnereticum]